MNVEPPCTFRTQFVALKLDPLTYRATPTKKRLIPVSVTVAPFRTVIDVPGPPEPLYVTPTAKPSLLSVSDALSTTIRVLLPPISSKLRPMLLM